MPVPPRIFSPEALADARFRYVETDETNVSIARRLRDQRADVQQKHRQMGLGETQAIRSKTDGAGCAGSRRVNTCRS